MRRTVRLWRWRSNPLKRRSDVVEAWAGVVAGVVMAVGAPLAGIAAADATHASLAEQSRDRHRVAAVLEHGAPSLSADRGSGVNPDEVRAPVHWKGTDGREHSAHVVVQPGADRGSTTAVWVDGRDRVTEPPLDGLASAVQTDIMGGSAAVGLCVLALAAHRGLRAGLDLRRSRRWQREWEQVGPQWSGHRA